MSSSNSGGRRWLKIVSIVVALVVVVAAVAVGAVWWTTKKTYTVADPAPVAGATSSFSEPDAGSVIPDVSAAIKGVSEDPALGTLSAHVMDTLTGQVLWEKDATAPLVPASSTKLTTAAAALMALKEDDVQTTAVVQEAPGQLVIVGGGDITLSENPGDGFYTDAASIQDLADQVAAGLQGQAVTSIRVDNSIRQGDLFNSTWDRADVAGGNVTDLDAVMMNGGRVEASDSYSPRSTTPGYDVASMLASKLAAGGVNTEGAQISVTDQPAATEAQQLGAVQSAPLDVRMRDMLVHSDNLLAESIAREVAAARGKPQTFEGATQATTEILVENGIDMNGTVLRDNSGMSPDNRLNAMVLDSILANEKFRPMLDALPISSVDGTLADRYEAGSGAESSKGYVRAKTGTLEGVNALAGTVMSVNGRPLTFAFLSNGSVADEARPALDRLANALHNAQ